MKTLLLSLPLLFLSIFAFAQYPVITYNYEKNHFNEGLPLPAEKYFIIAGEVRPTTMLVVAELYTDTGKEGREPLHTNSWKRQFDNTGTTFQVPIHHNLRGGEEFDIRLLFYERVKPAGVQNIRTTLFQSLDTYLLQHLGQKKGKIRLLKSSKALIEDMNQIVKQGLGYYKSQIGFEFNGFSEVAKNQLDLLTKQQYRESLWTDSVSLTQSRDNPVAAVLEQLHAEVNTILNGGLYVIRDIRKIEDYPSEKVRNVLTLHGGYGGAAFNYSLRDPEFSSSAMAGITLPLGKRVFNSRFWSNTAIMVGVYLQDFETEQEGVRATSPIVSRPLYAGLGYRVFQFIRLSAGVTVLENRAASDAVPKQFSEDIYIRPYVGLTADIRLWLGWGK